MSHFPMAFHSSSSHSVELNDYERDKLKADDEYYRTFPAAAQARFGSSNPYLTTATSFSAAFPFSTQFKSYTLLSPLDDVCSTPMQYSTSSLSPSPSPSSSSVFDNPSPPMSSLLSQDDTTPTMSPMPFSPVDLKPSVDGVVNGTISPMSTLHSPPPAPSPKPKTKTKAQPKASTSKSSTNTRGSTTKRKSNKPRKESSGSTTTSKSNGTGASSSAGGSVTGRRRSTIMVEDASGKKQPRLACYFCRHRKIACGPPEPENPDQTCNQCARRGNVCQYPEECRRGVRKTKAEKEKEKADFERQERMLDIDVDMDMDDDDFLSP